MTILRTQNLTVGYRKRRAETAVLRNLNLTLNRGELVCLLGANGVGKSTLMRTLAGMQPALNGDIWLDDVSLFTLPPRELAKKLSIVLTERVDVGLLSAYDLVALGRYPYTDWQGRLTANDDHIIQTAIHSVGAQSLAHRPVSELSDGERQKIMIARALAQDPMLILLDEPTAFLDLPRRVEIMRILRQLAHEDGRTILLSTHDLDLALRNADTIWLVSDGVVHVGAPEDLVLNGRFAHAFASEGVTFDMQSGAFRVESDARRTVNVIGEGVEMVWIARALERKGYAVHRGERHGEIVVVCGVSDEGRWRVEMDGSVFECGTVSEVVDVIDTYES